MREIKFRAWDGKQMLNRELHDRNWYTNENLCVKGTHPDDSHHLITMQYTGLKDKNNVGIFEGDIVGWINNDTGIVDNGAIEWDKEYAGFGITGEHCLDWNHMLEVIGNIHQTPELLTK